MRVATIIITAVLLLIINHVAAQPLKIISYNIWFDDESGIAHRYRQIAQFLQAQQG